MPDDKVMNSMKNDGSAPIHAIVQILKNQKTTYETKLRNFVHVEFYKNSKSKFEKLTNDFIHDDYNIQNNQQEYSRLNRENAFLQIDHLKLNEKITEIYEDQIYKPYLAMIQKFIDLGLDPTQAIGRKKEYRPITVKEYDSKLDEFKKGEIAIKRSELREGLKNRLKFKRGSPTINFTHDELL